MTFRWCLTSVFLLSGCDKLFSLQHIDYDAPPPCEPRSAATGRDHTCAVDYRGHVLCWGLNDYGQVQPGGPEVVLQPTEMVLPALATQITTGREHTCARLEDESVWCWGNYYDNQLGAGPSYKQHGPFQLPGIGPAAEVRAGAYHTCTRSSTDGTIWCWGRNGDTETGQTGPGLDCDPTRTDEEPCVGPAPVPGTAGSKALALGHRFSCVIDANDRVACWGRNHKRQLGFSSSGEDSAVPTVVEQLGPVSTLGASGRTTCAIEISGGVKCWGASDDGQLGTGTFGDTNAPPTSALVENARALAIGNFGSCALLADGKISCWGDHDAGEGVRVTNPMPHPSQVVRARQIASHFFHTCAIADGQLQCWGDDGYGQLGRGTRSLVTQPVPVTMPTATAIAAGEDHMCAITSGGLYCWGDNDYGQAGNPDLVRTYEPTLVPTSVPLIGVVAAFQQTCVWGAGAAECWGRAQSGRLGTGIDARSQTRASVLPTGISSIALGNDHMCALLQDNTIRCHGYNGSGQLGVPTTMSTSTTGVTVTNSGSVGTISKIVAGGRHNCALTTTGVWCWGENGDGQLGNGDAQQQDQYIPQQVPAFLANDLAAGENFTCAIDLSNDLFCWGRNSNGQLGLGNRTSYPSPQKVPLPAKVAHIFTGNARVCATLTTGATYCWGDGDQGQIGNGTMGDSDDPVLIPQFAMATTGAHGASGSCAIVGGGVRCTGDWRMLGNGDRSLSTPMPVDLAIGTCTQ